MRTIRLSLITHAQAIRVPGSKSNSVQIDGADQDGQPVRIILQPQVLEQMTECLEYRSARHMAAVSLTESQ